MRLALSLRLDDGKAYIIVYGCSKMPSILVSTVNSVQYLFDTRETRARVRQVGDRVPTVNLRIPSLMESRVIDDKAFGA